MTAVRPSFAGTIVALRFVDPRFPWIVPAPDEEDVAEALEVVQSEHQGDSDDVKEFAGREHWGRCRSCGIWWPCPTWIESESLAVQYLGRAADRVMARARLVSDKALARQTAESIPTPRQNSPETEPAA